MDASLVASGGVLLQTDTNGIYHPCAYLSQSFSPAERNYPIHDRELLAIIRALTHWRHYLEGHPQPVIVFTDHMNLLYFTKAERLSRRQARWQLLLTSFDLKLYHVPGSKLVVPDALSRRPDHGDGSEDNADTILLPDSMFIRLIDDELRAAIASTAPLDDPLFSAAQDALNGLCLPPMKSSLSDWHITDNILFYKNRAYIPPAQRPHLLRKHHDHPSAGHPGRFKTEELVKREAWWPSMGTYIWNYVDGCATCQQMKVDTHPVTPPLHPISTMATRPFSQISVDLITDLPVSSGFDSIMVVVDHGLSKGVIITPCHKTITSEGVAKLFLKHIFKRFGLHDKVISDRGPQFLSRFSIELARLLDYSLAPSTAYHPQTDGQTEQLNQELETYLRMYCQNNPSEWAEHIPMAEFVHNHRRHSAKDASPFFIMMGYEPKALPHLLPESNVPAAEERVRILQKIREEAISCHNIAMQRMAERSFGQKYQPWKVGDKVWLSAANLRLKLPSRKLAPKRYGPFTIMAVLSPITFTLQLPPQWKIHPTFHASQLSSYRENDVHGPNFPEPPPDVLEEEEEYEIEAILAHKGTGSRQ
jgi:RNase H-like domain found in reverse transcriptase/Integrase zinc binding domain